MDVTLANIRREFATPRTLWVQVLGMSAGLAVVLEVDRGVLAAHGSWTLVAGLTLVLGGLAYGLAVLAAHAVRRSSFEAELWRKFGLDLALLDACRLLPVLTPESEAACDLLLRDLRSLAAVRNNAAWDEPGAPDPGAVVERAETAVRALFGAGAPPAALAALAADLATATQSQRAALAAWKRDDAAELAALWPQFEQARQRLADRAAGADPA